MESFYSSQLVEILIKEMSYEDIPNQFLFLVFLDKTLQNVISNKIRSVTNH